MPRILDSGKGRAPRVGWFGRVILQHSRSSRLMATIPKHPQILKDPLLCAENVLLKLSAIVSVTCNRFLVNPQPHSINTITVLHLLSNRRKGKSPRGHLHTKIHLP